MIAMRRRIRKITHQYGQMYAMPTASTPPHINKLPTGCSCVIIQPYSTLALVLPISRWRRGKGAIPPLNYGLSMQNLELKTPVWKI